MHNLIRKFSGNNVVHSIGSRNARGVVKEDNEMHVREATLLILDSVDISFSSAKNAFLHNVI